MDCLEERICYLVNGIEKQNKCKHFESLYSFWKVNSLIDCSVNRVRNCIMRGHSPEKNLVATHNSLYVILFPVSCDLPFNSWDNISKIQRSSV